MSKSLSSPSDRAPLGLVDQACELAADLLKSAIAARTAEEKTEARKMTRLLADPNSKELTFHLADEVFRPPTHRLQAQTFRRLVSTYGAPDYLTGTQRFLMKTGAFVSHLFPWIVMPAVTAQIRQDSQRVILPREDKKLGLYFQSRDRVNVNLLGEAILGEKEAENRLQQNIVLLQKPDCTYLSVKISSIFSQINLLDEEGTLSTICDRLRILYRAAISASPDKPKFINLDMEEYRDLNLTYQSFRKTLSEPEFENLEAGIVLQAYLPDSYEVLKELTDWAKTRPASIKVRIVKGANLAMEKVEASHHDWSQAPYTEKVDVDANYKRMLHFACLPENAEKVRVGVASHNLFDIAYALLLRSHHEVEDRIELEMLEGMANDQARVISKMHSPVLFYAPIVRQGDFHSAIAYLVRRLDENTSEENFLAHVFSMTPGDAAWQEQEKRFRDACTKMETVFSGARRQQDRNTLVQLSSEFRNSPETDWILPANRNWLNTSIENYSEPDVPGLASLDQVEQALNIAASAPPLANPVKTLRKVAIELEAARGRLIATMRLDASKRPFESDVEVSEAVDFANYYAESISTPGFTDGTEATPIGTIVITPPWNFPCAIPCGGILAALAAGNSVIIKPAPETILTAWEMVQCLWAAGISKDLLQFLPCPNNEIGKALVSSEKVAAVILTGGSETADLFQSWNPQLNLLAETSGKNALIITAAADPDLAIKDLVKSAFGHAGQKCSAASLALIQQEVYDSPSFLTTLKDAAKSLPVGPATDPAAIVTPLIREAGPDLHRGLTQLDHGESWLLEPKQISETLWTPGIRIGVRTGSWIHKTELFGPVLSIIRVTDLKEAIAIQNSSDFGLTGGLHSLDPDEISLWREQVEVGNAYINRPITGAIVRRQPFGGWKRSSVGPGAKAGGPNYVNQFFNWTETDLPNKSAKLSHTVTILLGKLTSQLPQYSARLTAAAKSYAYWWKTEFSQHHDPSQLLGETNEFRYRPAACVIPDPNFSPEDLALIKLAAATVGTTLTEQSNHPLAKKLTKKPFANGRIELLSYLNEQSITETTHRHGRISKKSGLHSP